MASHGWIVVAFLIAFIDLACAVSGVGLDFVYNGDNAYASPRALLVNSCGQPIRQLVSTQFSFCLYVYIDAPRKPETVSLVSFSSRESGQYNEILLELEYGENYVDYIINGGGKGFKTLPPLNRWTHLCLTWVSDTGRISFYIDGTQVEEAEGVQEGVTIGGQGYLVLGQDQDDYNSGFEPETGLRGRITQFQMWDREITASEVSQARNCKLQGNVVNWENSTWSFLDGTQLRQSTSPCSNYLTC